VPNQAAQASVSVRQWICWKSPHRMLSVYVAHFEMFSKLLCFCSMPTFVLDECLKDDDCPVTKACVSKECKDPCLLTACGRQATCLVEYHRARCSCPSGLQGNPLVSCEQVGCRRDEDCQQEQRCDYASRNCLPLCTGNPCVSGASCRAQNHKEVCQCNPPLQGDGYSFCEKRKPPIVASQFFWFSIIHPLSSPALAPDEPECRIDKDCPLTLSCIQESCQNLCQTRNPCSGNLVCSVEDSANGKRVVACTCPDGYFASGTSMCEKGTAIFKARPTITTN
jgi:hypothetical protein